MSLVAEIWSILTPRQRRYILAAQVVSLVMAFSTVTGIAAIAPFFAVLGEPQLIDHNRLTGFCTGCTFTADSPANAASSRLSVLRSSPWC
jgi:hypothetical protein